MAQKILTTILLLSSFSNISMHKFLKCDYSVWNNDNFGPTYSCFYSNHNQRIESVQDAKVINIIGDHKFNNHENDVSSFVAQYKVIKYFPQGLGYFFPNLEIVIINSCQLREIHQWDLQQFPNLIRLDLEFNQIEYLESDLFDSNRNLNRISFAGNKIFYIHTTVFTNLKKLTTLKLDLNKCIKKSAVDDSGAVQELIWDTKMKCTNLEFLNLKEKFGEVEDRLSFTETKSIRMDISTKMMSERMDQLKLDINIIRYGIVVFLIFVVIYKIFSIFKGAKKAEDNCDVES